MASNCSIPSFQDMCNQFFRTYIDYVTALSLPRPTSDGPLEVDELSMERFLHAVESSGEPKVLPARAAHFRAGVLQAVTQWYSNRGSYPPYTIHERLKSCIEYFVLRHPPTSPA